MKKPNVYNPQIIVSNFNNGKPYYGILYYDVDDREWHEGYCSHYLDYLRISAGTEFGAHSLVSLRKYAFSFQ